MINQGTVTAEQLLSFIIVNLVGVALVGLIILFVRLIRNNPNKKIILSIGVGLIAEGIMIIAFLDVGVYLWVTSRNFRSVYSVLPLNLLFVPNLISSNCDWNIYSTWLWGENLRKKFILWQKKKHLRINDKVYCFSSIARVHGKSRKCQTLCPGNGARERSGRSPAEPHPPTNEAILTSPKQPVF